VRFHPVRRGLGAAAPAVALVATIALPVTAAAKPSAIRATPTISRVSISGENVRIAGLVTFTRDTAAVRHRTRVQVTLSAPGATTERRTVSVAANRVFRAAWTTTLAGRVKVDARAEIAGRWAGDSATRMITITPLSSTPSAGAATPLVGLFKLAAGNDPAGATPTGSYFEMLQSNGQPLGNLSSPGGNKDFTPFTPGTDGGLTTQGYQPAPSPAFAGGNSGSALASRIIQPVPFYGINFSVETAPTDAQTGTSDPVPVVRDADGVLSGQLTAWDAQWNGQSFNQGTPKPNGTTPAPTTPLTGSYDAASGRFTLQWKSLIVGGPFNGFTGLWHLAGTFIPAKPATKSTGLGTPLPTL
jgi:hypothetical protein